MEAKNRLFKNTNYDNIRRLNLKIMAKKHPYPPEIPESIRESTETHDDKGDRTVDTIGASVQRWLANIQNLQPGSKVPVSVVKMKADTGLIDIFKRNFPDARQPSLEILAGKLLNIEIFLERTLEIHTKALHRRLKPKAKSTLADGASLIFTAETLSDIFIYLKELYALILELTAYFTVEGTVFLSDTTTFTLDPKSINLIIRVLKKMQDAYPVEAQKLAAKSEKISLLVNERRIQLQQKDPCILPSSQRTGFAILAREYANIVVANGTNAMKAAQSSTPDTVADTMATALEASLFTTTLHVGNMLAPAYELRGSEYFFEKHFPFKLDFILMSTECIISLLPQLRILLDVLQKAHTYSNGLQTKH